MGDERLTDEQVRGLEHGIIKALETVLDIGRPTRKTSQTVAWYTEAVSATFGELLECRARVAELEAEIAKLNSYFTSLLRQAYAAIEPGVDNLLRGMIESELEIQGRKD